MKILHHGYAYPNYCKCRSCDCEFIYEENETVSMIDDRVYHNPKPFVWTYIRCPECNEYNVIYNYKGKINGVRVYRNTYSDNYDIIDFDENTMDRR